jgi:hypothetical protein
MIGRRLPYCTKRYDINTILLLHAEDFIDSSASKRTINNHGVTLSSSQKKFGNASFYFNGSSYLDFTPYTIGASDYTVELWLYNRATSNAWRRWITSTIGDFNENATFCLREGNSGQIQINFLSVSKSAVRNAWAHYAITRTGGTTYLFVNGALISSGVSTVSNFSEPLAYIGGYYSGSGAEYFIGYMDEIRVSNIARWTANFTPPTEPYSK